MGLFSSSPAEKEIYKFVGGLMLRSYFVELLKLNGLYDVIDGKSSGYVGDLIQSCLEVKIKRKEITVAEIEPEFYLLVKKAIYIHNHNRELFLEFCPKCHRNLTFSVCNSCGFNILDDYDINLNELNTINIKLPNVSRSPYSKVIDVKVLNYINNKSGYNKLTKSIGEIPKLKKHKTVKTNVSSNESEGVQNIINNNQSNYLESNPNHINTSIPKTYTLEDFEFNIPQGFESNIEYGYDGKVIKAKNNENVEITILFKLAHNCFTLEQGYYYSFIMADRLCELTDVPPDTYEGFPQNLVLNINGVEGIFLDESYELTVGKIFNRYNFVFTKNEKNYFIKVNVEEINKHINIKELLEEILPE